MEKAPDAFRTISEVADELDLPQHVLRFWESRFTQIKPLKRGGGRRYYRPEEVALLRGIRHLLYGQGYTIRGVQRILREQGVRFVQAVWLQGAEQPRRVETEPAPRQTTAEEEEGPDAVLAAEPRQSELPGLRVGQDRETTDPARASVQNARLSDSDRKRLQAALDELTEGRRLLDAALEGLA